MIVVSLRYRIVTDTMLVVLFNMWIVCDAQVYGHTHMNAIEKQNGRVYVQHALGYDGEHTNSTPLQCVWDGTKCLEAPDYSRPGRRWCLKWLKPHFMHCGYINFGDLRWVLKNSTGRCWSFELRTWLCVPSILRFRFISRWTAIRQIVVDKHLFFMQTIANTIM